MLVDENVRLGAILLAILLESHGRSVGLLYSFSGRAVNDYGGMLGGANAGRDFERDSMNRAQTARSQHYVMEREQVAKQSSTLQGIVFLLPLPFSDRCSYRKRMAVHGLSQICSCLCHCQIEFLSGHRRR